MKKIVFSIIVTILSINIYAQDNEQLTRLLQQAETEEEK